MYGYDFEAENEIDITRNNLINDRFYWVIIEIEEKKIVLGIFFPAGNDYG